MIEYDRVPEEYYAFAYLVRSCDAGKPHTKARTTKQQGKDVSATKVPETKSNLKLTGEATGRETCKKTISWKLTEENLSTEVFHYAFGKHSRSRIQGLPSSGTQQRSFDFLNKKPASPLFD